MSTHFPIGVFTDRTALGVDVLAITKLFSPSMPDGISLPIDPVVELSTNDAVP